jgi:hypothetical protein
MHPRTEPSDDSQQRASRPTAARAGRWLAALACAAGLLAGCSEREFLNKISTPADQAFAQGYVAKLQARDFDAIERELSPDLKNDQIRSVLERMADMLPAGEPTSVTLVGAQRYKNADSTRGTTTRVNTTMEYSFGGRYVVINVATDELNGATSVVGFNVYPRSTSLEDENRFTLKDRRPVQYLILVLAVMSLLVSLGALIACIRTKPLASKWLWILVTLVSVGHLTVNWTTGQVSFVPISLSLLGAGAFATSHYAPWMITAALPIGPIGFLIFRRQLRRQSAAQPPPASPG